MYCVYCNKIVQEDSNNNFRCHNKLCFINNPSYFINKEKTKLSELKSNLLKQKSVEEEINVLKQENICMQLEIDSLKMKL